MVSSWSNQWGVPKRTRDGWPIGDDLAWSRLLEALGVIDPNPTRNRPVVAPLLVPTVEMVRYPVAEVGLVTETIGVTSSGAVGITVPDDEDWLVHSVFFYDSTGTWTCNSIRVADAAGISQDLVTFTATKVQAWMPSEGMPLPHEWNLGPYVNSHSVNGNLILRIFRTVYRRVTTPS